MTPKVERESSEPPSGGSRFQFIVGAAVLLLVAGALFGGPYIADATTAKPIKTDAFSHHKVPISPSR